MEYVLICQSLFVRINRSDELSVWRIKRSQLYMELLWNNPSIRNCHLALHWNPYGTPGGSVVLFLLNIREVFKIALEMMNPPSP